MKRVPAGYDPCTEAYVTKYFNRGDVQRALHANRTRLPYPYSPCRSDSTPQLLFLFSAYILPVPAMDPCARAPYARRRRPQLLFHLPPPARSSSDLGNLRAH